MYMYGYVYSLVCMCVFMMRRTIVMVVVMVMTAKHHIQQRCFHSNLSANRKPAPASQVNSSTVLHNAWKTRIFHARATMAYNKHMET